MVSVDVGAWETMCSLSFSVRPGDLCKQFETPLRDETRGDETLRQYLGCAVEPGLVCCYSTSCICAKGCWSNETVDIE